MAVLLEYISVNTFWTILLTIHMLLAVALLGAVTHQAIVVLAPARRATAEAGFVTRVRRVQGASYAGAVCLLWVLAFIFGGWIYTKYRISIRVPIELEGFWKTQGMFDLKEHLAAVGLGMLPIYWYFWRHARNAEYDSARRWTTVLLATMVWFMFLVGHIVNNVRGFGA